MAYQVLLTEDDSKIREIISDYINGLPNSEIELSVAKDGNEALELIFENVYDLAVLDIMLPGADGFTICREIRNKSIIPIIFLTARGREEDILYGYDLGCDDYIVKPFSLPTLYAKMMALLKRVAGMVGTKTLTCGGITLNPSTLRVTVNNQDIDLAPKEYTLLKYLMENKGNVLTRDTLLTRIWGYDFDGSDRVVDSHIKKLRKALGNEGKHIKTIITKGYRMEDAI